MAVDMKFLGLMVIRRNDAFNLFAGERKSWLLGAGNRLYSAVMHLVRENLFIGNISDAAEVLQNGSAEVTHLLSVLSSASISFFSEWRSSLTIPSKEIKEVYVGGLGGSVDSEDVRVDGSKSCLSPEKLLYSLEHAGKDLKFVRMAVPIRDTESEVLLDYLDPCLEFIEKSRKEGSVLVHCFAGVSRRCSFFLVFNLPLLYILEWFYMNDACIQLVYFSLTS